MVNSQPLGPLGLGPTRGVDGARSGGAAAPSANPAFEALLDNLEQRASSLRERSAGELDSQSLPGAVGEARDSLEAMLTLKDQLLEAWRASQHGGGGA
jgi:hypothetical protein